MSKVCVNISNLYNNCTMELIKYATSEAITEYETITQFINMAVPIFFSITGILGFIGNMLVVFVLLRADVIRRTYNNNILIINLAVSDFLFVVFCIPFTASDYMYPTWLFGDYWCKTFQYVTYVTTSMSVYILILMSFDRLVSQN